MKGISPYFSVQHFDMLSLYRMAILCGMLWLTGGDLRGQKLVEWISSDYVEYDQARYGKLRRAIGSVQFRHEGTYLFCDSAYFYEETNRIEAYSNVHVQDSDTLNLFCGYLEYMPATRLAIARQDVVLVDPQVSLTTDVLNYDLESKVAYYDQHGVIVSQTNTLTSKKGRYFTRKKLFIFEEDVVLEHSRFTLYTDTLHYQTDTEVAEVYGPTRILSDENDIYTELGNYDTKKDFSVCRKNNRLQNKENILECDSLEYDRTRSFARAFNNVTIRDTVNQTLFAGHFGEYDEHTGYTLLTDSAWAMLVDSGDTLTLRADTLHLTFDSLQTGKVFRGYYGVLFYRNDVQGACDSIVYLFADSVITMHHQPVIWFGKNQVVADTITMYIENEMLSRMVMDGAAFIMSDDLSEQFNQIKGKRVVSFFEDGDLRTMNVEGSVETLYYVREEDQTLIGIDKGLANRLRIEFSDGEAESIIYIDKPEGVTYPEHELPQEERRLKDFLSRHSERPSGREEIIR